MKKIIGLAALAVAGTVLAAKPDYATFICHRGESHDAPENTLPAYKMAVDRGFGFECDIYLSADKRVFTFHDGNLKRTTAGACTKKCAEASWAEEISKVDVGGWGKWKGSKFSPTRPALLEEVLELAVDGRQIYVEVKPGPEIVPYIKAVYAKQKKATNKNTLFIAFNRETCKELKKQMPEYKVYWLGQGQEVDPDHGGLRAAGPQGDGRGRRGLPLQAGRDHGRLHQGDQGQGLRVPRMDDRQPRPVSPRLRARRPDRDDQLREEAARRVQGPEEQVAVLPPCRSRSSLPSST